MKVGIMLTELHRSETALFHDLLELSQRNIAEHEVHHVSKDLAQWCRSHLAEIADVAVNYEQTLEPEISDSRASKEARPEYDASFGVDNPSGLPLLWDLRSIYMAAGGVSMQWTTLHQAALALNHPELLATVTKCHPQTQRQMAWAQAEIKQLFAQILVS